MDYTKAIEGFNVSDLNWGTANAQTITISFWVRSSLTGTFGGNSNLSWDTTNNNKLTVTGNISSTTFSSSITNNVSLLAYNVSNGCYKRFPFSTGSDG